MKRFYAIVLLSITAFCLCSCGQKEAAAETATEVAREATGGIGSTDGSKIESENTPEQIVDTYFAAVRYGDVETAISCFTPDTQAEWKSITSISDSVAGKLIGFDNVSELLNGIIAGSNTDYYKDYDFSVVRTDYISDEDARVTVNVSNGDGANQETTVDCALINNKWYIKASGDDSIGTGNLIDAKQGEYDYFDDYSFETSFHNGYAWVEYVVQDNDSNLLLNNKHIARRAALIDERGEEVYEIKDFDDDAITLYDVDDSGHACYCVSTSNGKQFVSITPGQQGVVCLLAHDGSNDGEDSWIIGIGSPGIYLRRNHVSNFKEDKYYLELIDACGNPIYDEVEDITDHNNSFNYLGNSLFGELHNNPWIYNADNGTLYKLDHDLIIENIKGNDYIVTVRVPWAAWYNRSGSYLCYKIPSQTLESEENFEKWYSSITESTETYEDFVPPVDYGENVKVLDIGESADGYYPVLLKGADSKYYYTVVDENGDERFEPIKLNIQKYSGEPKITDLTIHDLVLVYQDEDGGTFLLDADGTFTEIPFETGHIYGFDGKFLNTKNGCFNLLSQEKLKVYSTDLDDDPNNAAAFTPTNKEKYDGEFSSTNDSSRTAMLDCEYMTINDMPCAVGKVSNGYFKVGDSVELVLENGERVKSTIKEMRMQGKQLKECQEGDELGIIFEDMVDAKISQVFRSIG